MTVPPQAAETGLPLPGLDAPVGLAGFTPGGCLAGTNATFRAPDPP